MASDVALSFEFFPPKDNIGTERLLTVANRLSAYCPDFFSMTFGAGGGYQHHTPEAVAALIAQPSVAVAPHISCMAASPSVVLALLQRYQAMGIKRLVVLRGDRPSGWGGAAGAFEYASDLIQFIRQQTGDHFSLDVAAYPECHPESMSMQQDIQALKIKQDAGADRAITQYFFNIDSYYHYCEACQKAGVTLPIVPGIMPITRFDNLQRFSARCEAEIPRWLVKLMANYVGDVASQQSLGLEVVSHLCEQLLALEVGELHFYTLNRSKAVMAILGRLGSKVVSSSLTP